MAAGQGAGLYVETRPGRRVRCEEYCPVDRWCNQYQQYLKTKETSDERATTGNQEPEAGAA